MSDFSLCRSQIRNSMKETIPPPKLFSDQNQSQISQFFNFFLNNFSLMSIRVCISHTHMRAKTVIHAEYEIIQHILDEIEIHSVRQRMVTDKHSEKRFETGAKNVSDLITNLAKRRLHRLPKDHEDYQEK